MNGKSLIKGCELAEWAKRNPIRCESAARIIKAPISTKQFLDKICSNLTLVENGNEETPLAQVILEFDVKNLMLSMRPRLRLDATEGSLGINISGLGRVRIAIRRCHDTASKTHLYSSLFVGGNLNAFEFAEERKAADSTRGIMQRIVDGKGVLLKNVELFASAIEQGKIALE